MDDRDGSSIRNLILDGRSNINGTAADGEHRVDVATNLQEIPGASPCGDCVQGDGGGVGTVAPSRYRITALTVGFGSDKRVGKARDAVSDSPGDARVQCLYDAIRLALRRRSDPQTLVEIVTNRRDKYHA